MWRKKKVITGAVITAVVLAASIGGGIALAADGEDESEAAAHASAVWDKMAEALQEDGIAVTADQLQSAYSEAREGMREGAFQNFLDEQVSEGIITQEQADDYREWIEARPDIGEAYRDWMEAKPDMGDEFGHGGFFRHRIETRGFGGPFNFDRLPDPDNIRSFGGMRGFGGPCPSIGDTE
jgi:hypothetical protein